MRVFLACVGWVVASTVAFADQPRPAASPWIETSEAAVAVKADIKIPITAATLKKTELKQFDQDGIDLYAQYESPDQAVFGTIFIYAPTLPDIGLTFLATDEAIRRRFGTSTHVVDDRLIPVAGVPKSGRRIIYEGVDGGKLVSAAIFVRAGPWIIVGRVTGPADRADKINSALDGLIAGMAFPKGSEPLPAKVITSEPCSPLDRTTDANLRKPPAAEAMAFALVAEPESEDEKGHSAINPLREAPNRLCLESNETQGKTPLLTFRAVDKDGLPYSPRLYVLYGDAGIMLEVSESRKQPGSFYAIRHGVGRMYVFGSLDRIPSKSQTWALIASPDNQPAVAMFNSRFISPKGSEDLTIYCNNTAEGCPKEK